MDGLRLSRYSWLDFAFTLSGVCAYLFDVGSDVWVASEFYVRGDLFWFAVMVALMLLSSVVVQAFSWFWIQYDRDLEEKNVVLVCAEQRPRLSCCLHVLQLGFFFRHVTAIWQGFRVWWRKEQGAEYAVLYLTHDLSMLRLIETFCESAPQLTLMTYIMLHDNAARTVQCVSVAASIASIAWMVVDYHRALRSFLPDKAKQAWLSSFIYFLWNLMLIAPRVAAVALFASVLSHFVALHFLALWVVFVVWVWRQKTDFMDSRAGEWLYRATVAMIWYFSWFNVSEGRTRGRSTIYHSFMMADSTVLLVTWWWYRDPENTEPYARILAAAVPLVYAFGLLVKFLYYYRFHPKLWRPRERAPAVVLETDSARVAVEAATQMESEAPPTNRRMAKHAKNFYSGDEVQAGASMAL
uniref:XK-related protein n=1 Tax=Denticeps clupeoides TaxID=299321 RepID=A0AAY4E7V5_9TELE